VCTPAQPYGTFAGQFHPLNTTQNEMPLLLQQHWMIIEAQTIFMTVIAHQEIGQLV